MFLLRILTKFLQKRVRTARTSGCLKGGSDRAVGRCRDRTDSTCSTVCVGIRVHGKKKLQIGWLVTLFCCGMQEGEEEEAGAARGADS